MMALWAVVPESLRAVATRSMRQPQNDAVHRPSAGKATEPSRDDRFPKTFAAVPHVLLAGFCPAARSNRTSIHFFVELFSPLLASTPICPAMFSANRR
jgi:hypothetical protein